MISRATARPAKQPVRAAAAPGAKKAPAKTTVRKVAEKKAAAKTVSKKKVLKKTVPKKAAAGKIEEAEIEPGPSPEPLPPATSKPPLDRAQMIRLDRKRKAAVAARNKTIDTTLVRVGDTDPVIDDDDIAARQKLSKIRRTAIDRLDDPPTATGAALVERVTRAVERELLQIEIIVGGHRVKPQQRTEAERRARTLASLARTLSEVRRLRAAEDTQRGADGSPAGASRGPSAARDLDAFRRILSQRLEGMVARTTDLPAAADERGGDG